MVQCPARANAPSQHLIPRGRCETREDAWQSRNGSRGRTGTSVRAKQQLRLNTDVRFWHKWEVRECPLLRRLQGLSGHSVGGAERSRFYEHLGWLFIRLKESAFIRQADMSRTSRNRRH